MTRCVTDNVTFIFTFSFDVDERIGEAWPVKCCFVVREIIQTEIAYVQSLGEIIKVDS